MYTIKWYAENGIYEASGAASANSLFFETKADHVLFLRLWNQFMSHYADMHHYSFTETSWAVIFRTKNKDIILEEYNTRFRASKKVVTCKRLHDVGRILSQAMRLFLSNYVAMSNRNVGKTGSRVRRRFYKYGFSDLEDMKNRIKVFERMQRLYEQQKVKFRPDLLDYDEDRAMGYRCKYRSAYMYYHGYEGDHFCVKNFSKLVFSGTVLRSNFINETFSITTPKSPKNPPPKPFPDH